MASIFQCIFLNENVWIFIKISLEFVPKGPINNIPALVQIMAWRRPGEKPSSKPMMVSLTMHIFVTWPRWVNSLRPGDAYRHQWTASSLVQVMACCLTGAKPLPEPMIWKTFHWFFFSKIKYYAQWNALENAIHKMSAILSWSHFADNFLNAFSWMEISIFGLKFHWKLLLRVQMMVRQHWFR